MIWRADVTIKAEVASPSRKKALIITFDIVGKVMAKICNMGAPSLRILACGEQHDACVGKSMIAIYLDARAS